MENDTRGQGEIIIVRRSGGHGEDEHHGGVWKIAFADFMTAMMAFFLVMWLINASNEETKQALASYFNPVKLMDTTSNPKGVRNPKYGVEATEVDTEEESTKVSTPEKKQAPGETIDKAYDEQALFVDPFSLLSEIEAGMDPEAEDNRISNDGDRQNRNGLSLNSGPSFQDPFDPTAWNIREGEISKNSQSSEPSEQTRELGDFEESEGVEAARKEELAQNQEEESAAGEATEALEEQPEEVAAEISELADSLDKRVKELKEQVAISGLDVEVQRSASGASVVLSDKSQTGMFSIGSARPTQEMVRIMAGIGEAVAKHQGRVEISGHTDGRKYQSGDYDNWRLSTARAHMAYYMLVRGGMNENQVDRIVGQADASLRVPDDPYSPANRRIEVLLKLK